MSFWDNQVTGKPEDSFTKDFSVIPNNTQATAQIRNVELLERTPQDTPNMRYHKITWKIVSGEFTNREIAQNIYTFEFDHHKKLRAQNMLKLIMNLCNFQLNHDNIPMTSDLQPMVGKILGIKIRELETTNSKGDVIFKNWISEVHPANNEFQTITGIKLMPKKISVTKYPEPIPNIADTDDIPF